MLITWPWLFYMYVYVPCFFVFFFITGTCNFYANNVGHGLCIFSIRSHGSLWVGNSNKIEFLMTCSLVFNWKNVHNANFTVIGVGLISLLHLIACLLKHENGQIKNQIISSMNWYQERLTNNIQKRKNLLLIIWLGISTTDTFEYLKNIVYNALWFDLTKAKTCRCKCCCSFTFFSCRGA